MTALEEVTRQLAPQIDQLVEHLTLTEEMRGAAFFSSVGEAVRAVKEEADLLEVFFALSTTAFQGFVFDPLAARMVDEILAYAEQVSHAFMASEDVRH